MLSRVFDFNQFVVGIPPRPLNSFGTEEKLWMLKVLREEAQELEDAEELVDQVDALIDSIIFAVGGLYRLGLSEEQALAAIHAVMDANFEKKAGQKKGREFTGVADVVKPEGWVSPELRIIEVLQNV